ncbi:MAG: hypothetical protein ACOYM0_01155 [Bacteroidales bacterium]
MKDQKNSAKPIIFSTPMVQAILKGRKTMTRRVIKYKKEITDPQIGWTTFTPDGMFSVRGIHSSGEFGESFFNMPYKKGDVLWVRETFAPIVIEDYAGDGKDKYTWFYRADPDSDELLNNMEDCTWKPSIYMPRVACRIFLEITGVRIQKLQNIKSLDAINEGIEPVKYISETGGPGYRGYKCYFKDNGFPMVDPVASFGSLWASINGIESWQANPWVWVIEFKKL